MPPTRLGYIRISSVQPGAAAQPSSSPKASSGTAALPWPRISPWPTNSAPMRNRLWLLPPIAMAAVPIQPIVRGCGVGLSIFRFHARAVTAVSIGYLFCVTGN